MKVEDGLKATTALPPADVRMELLREQVGQLRRQFYGHLTDLQRYDAIDAAQGTDPVRDETRARLERDLDAVNIAIDCTLAELKKLDPDA